MINLIHAQCMLDKGELSPAHSTRQTKVTLFQILMALRVVDLLFNKAVEEGEAIRICRRRDDRMHNTIRTNEVKDDGLELEGREIDDQSTAHLN